MPVHHYLDSRLISNHRNFFVRAHFDWRLHFPGNIANSAGSNRAKILLLREHGAKRRYQFLYIRMERARDFHLAVNQGAYAPSLY